MCPDVLSTTNTTTHTLSYSSVDRRSKSGRIVEGTLQRTKKLDTLLPRPALLEILEWVEMTDTKGWVEVLIP